MAKDIPRQGYAIPPDRASVEAAMASPKGRPNRALGVFLLFLIGGLGIFFLPRLSKGLDSVKKPPVIRTIDPIYGEAHIYPDSFRLLVDLPAKKAGGRAIELEGELVFSYAADYDDFDAADAAIEAHWDEAAKLMLRMVAKHTRLEHIRDRVEIFDGMRFELNATLFPDGAGRVVQLDWQGKLSLH